jgi:hypothetical protein
MSDDDWSLFAVRPLRFGDVHVIWVKALSKLIRVDGAQGSIDVPGLERSLAKALPRA